MSKASLIRTAPAILLALVAIAGRPAGASAQSIGTGTVFSGPTTADGSSAFVNPAAMAAGTGTQIELDGGFSLIDLTYAPDDGHAPTSSGPIAPILTLGGYSAALHPNWRIGLTATVPSTTGGDWARDGGAAAITRYYVVEGMVYAISLAPAVSWSPAPWISFGVAANIVYGGCSMDFDKDLGSALNQTAGSTSPDSPFPYAHPDLAARVTAEGSGIGLGVIGGVFVQPMEELTLGASIHSPVSIPASGDLHVEYPPRVAETIAGILPSATLPELAGRFDVQLDRSMVITGGISARPIRGLELGLNYQFDQLSTQPNFYADITQATSQVIADTTKPQAYNDRHRVSARAVYAPIRELELGVFGAVQGNAIPDLTMAPNNLDFNRYEVGGAARWRIVEKLSVLVQYTHTFLDDRTVADSLHRPLAEPSLQAFNHPSPTGTYSGSANTVRLGVTLHL